jgi:hypothetical protein
VRDAVALVTTAHLENYLAITLAIFSVVGVWAAFLVWGWLSGQFVNNEQAKYRVFEDDVPSGPGREAQR